MIIDTHSHIFDETFSNDIDDVILRAKQAGVAAVLLPNIDTESIKEVNSLAERHKGYCLPMMGLHPTSVTKDWKKDLNIIKEQFSRHQYIAVGEIGIDLYWDISLAEEQKSAFEEQLRWSIEYNLPVSIHCRNAVMESVECIKKVGADKLKGSFHSFGGNSEELQVVLDLKNFYIGINGTVTYKNSTLPTVLQDADLSRIMVETDAPYLPPVPYRGKRNEPSYTSYIVDKLCDIYNTNKDDVENTTSNNAKKLFGINI
ncbi:TatD family deoxyribonuclease [Dysgonomonas capnocytophagoides]|uniref:TatD family deoxyribonuclease n=1 Tax=Dysgonomonas capnocytophagoides TaxID=45254 RepID=A0A4Y8L060_9BACT|nr:TatD family hydrolase [Dysgonomonas capnocytophagoides]TFD92797.1 TatD family deoxyribonuclease [Dysgonomonas capnocytophagoides]